MAFKNYFNNKNIQFCFSYSDFAPLSVAKQDVEYTPSSINGKYELVIWKSDPITLVLGILVVVTVITMCEWVSDWV